MLEDHKKGLYPNCEDGNTKLGTVLELLQWKAGNSVLDKVFEKLLKIKRNQTMCPMMMISAGSLSMQGRNVRGEAEVRSHVRGPQKRVVPQLRRC